VIGASELPLDPEVQAGRFRADLFKRFASGQITLVPLCERAEDIAVAATALMTSAPSRWGRPPRDFTKAALALLTALRWDRNLAELEALLRELALQGSHLPVRVEDVVALASPGVVASLAAPRVNLRDARRQFEREYIAAVLRHSEWRMDRAARLLGIQRTNLYRKARQLGIARRARGAE
jgi:DNA-binding NtrC family response regulator